MKFIRLLLQHKANINALNSHQETALMVAAQNSFSRDFIDFLLDHYADPMIKNPLKNDTFYLGININQFLHMKQFFKNLVAHHEKIQTQIIENTTLAMDVCPLICSYLSNEYPQNKQAKKKGAVVKKECCA